MTYSLILDIIIIIIAAIAIFRGAIKGFITTVFDMFTFVAAIALAAIFKNPVAQYIMNTPIFESTKSRIAQQLCNSIKNAGENLSSEEVLAAFEEDNAALIGIIEKFGGDMSSVRNYVSDYVAQTGDNLAESLSQFIMEPAANVCSQVLAFLAIFLLSLLALWILHKLLNAIFRLPILKQVNKIFGFLIGVIAGYLYASLLVALACPILENPELFGFALPDSFIENSYIFSYLKDNNIFYYIISLFTGNGTGV